MMTNTLPILLPARNESVPRARERVRTLLGVPGIGDSVAEGAELAVSELVANAVEATLQAIKDGCSVAPFVILVIHVDGGIINIAVWDSVPNGPDADVQLPEDESTSGRGMFIVDAFSDEWGIRKDVFGKWVWCSFLVRPESAGVSLKKERVDASAAA